MLCVFKGDKMKAYVLKHKVTGRYSKGGLYAESTTQQPEKIDQFKEEGILTSDGDIGCKLALINMIVEFMEFDDHKKETPAIELYASDHVYIFR